MTMLALPKDQADLREALHRVRDEGERFVIEQDGEPEGALVSVEDLRALEALKNEIDVREALRVLTDKSDETIPWEEAEKRLDACRG